ncbi:prolipoprotein diacylglyceryl transferase [Streptococcus iniae]|uniref:Phosphatidylglycerol--prolipoprotein diacylglyceryl transferase n=1 Tax=Streptococcus iniae TaxID=1346 RepID=A0A3L8GEV5_STRIN|nr:prolipoprotein diacylglyceryl transferase [Streptococcus iniae]AGM99148.1 prolipoprotein diacylglyceryl transferase [Streptococcus iniae SF1]AHY16088.1 prolipoprotein diacylglyceryl transferase [Streptococcus iniae]AHY17951.1 prolipoprotein diacylglyceryl transferase [Streptococcus iniae]AJG26247.1 prolipoprotein diacylglyceryl transferase [Streptococcus iniae]APD32124.1 prolipoprotein diacylglyceryl transferase [Streptococcus iniae]
MIDPIALKIGPFAIHWYALCIMLGLLLAVYLVTKEAPRKKITSDDVIDFVLIAFPLAILGARIYYVLFEWSYYSQHLTEIFAIWNGGIAIYGGLLTGVLVLLIYSYYKVINPIAFLDIIAPAVMIAQAIGRWGNFVNQEAYGKAVKSLNYLPEFIQKQMFIEGHYRQPTFLYESLWNLVGFVIIMVLRRKRKLLKEGEVLAFYLIWYGLGRMIIEGMRTDSLMLMGLRVSQILSAILIVTGITFVLVRRRRQGIPYYQE